MTTVWIIQHEQDVPAGTLIPFLEQAGAQIQLVRAWEGDALPEAGTEPIIILGGRNNAYGDKDWPWLTATKALIRDCINGGTPLLGICLGHQLMAVANGGHVIVDAATGPEYGMVQLDTGQWVFEDHADAVSTFGENAEVLAISRYPQIIDYGDNATARGVQFHPEVTEELVRYYNEENDETDTEAVVAKFLEYQDEVEQGCRDLVTWLLGNQQR